MVRPGFSTSNQWISRLIRKVTKGKTSHCWVTFYDDTLQTDLVLEASFWGYRLITLKQFLKDNVIIKIVDPIVPLEQGLIQAASWLGSYYDVEGMVSAGVAGLWYRWFKRRIKSPLHSGKALFCSESVLKIMQLSNWPGAAALDPLTINPQQLLDFCSK